MARTDTVPENIDTCFRYNPKTGVLVRVAQLHGGVIRRWNGKPAGTLKDGYININHQGALYRAHRLIWYMMTGEWLPRSVDIDHANGDRADNRWANLRKASRSQNNMNLPVKSDNRTGTRGVSWSKQAKKWDARITVCKKVICLGTHDRIEDAIAARKAAELKYFGEFSFLRRTN